MQRSPFAVLKSIFAITDEQAMWRLQTQDDDVAFAQLMRRWEKPIQSLCARMTGDAHRAEDLAQDVFTRVFARRKDYQPSGKFSTWLWRIALNLCHDELRRKQRRSECSFDEELSDDAMAPVNWPVTPVLMPNDAMEQNERAGMVREALLKLTESYRSVVVLRHYEDLKFREIAEVLGIPEGTVKSRMAEAMTQLGRLLQPVAQEESTPR